MYRRAAAATVGRRVVEVRAPDALMCRGGTTAEALTSALCGGTIDGARRVGKLLLLDVGSSVLGIRFGMTGRIVVDGVAPITELEYGSGRDCSHWDRFVLGFDGGGELRVNDPRRLGGVELDPDESRLGPDVFAVTRQQLAAALSGAAAVKARLLDQSRVAGIGNLLADEICWRAGVDPGRSAASLDRLDLERFHATLVGTLRDLSRRGGSHLGDLQPHRSVGAACPRDGGSIIRRTIGGRTTYSCSLHQR